MNLSEYYEKMRRYVCGMVPFSDERWERFAKHLNFIRCPKGQLLCKEGEVEGKLYFILSGIVRAYKVNPDGKEFSLYFNFANGFSTSYDSFLTQEPAVINTQVITEAELFFVTHADLQRLYEGSVEGERLGRLMAEQAYRRRLKHEMALQTLSAGERYRQLLQEHPDYIQLIPQKYLASYLGVEQESLSRIKRQIF
jgi:CRP-like cAMP-binding protein